jgi:hypothetical protein
VTTQGDNVLPKFFDRKGPSGWYSQGWMSRTDRSLYSATPNRCCSAASIAIGSHCRCQSVLVALGVDAIVAHRSLLLVIVAVGIDVPSGRLLCDKET